MTNPSRRQRAFIVISSPSVRKVRVAPSGSVSGSAPPRDFEHATKIVTRLTGNGAGAVEVACFDIAAVTGLMGHHLGWCPIQLGGRSRAQANGRPTARCHPVASKPGFDFDVDRAVLLIVRIKQIGKWFRIASAR